MGSTLEKLIPQRFHRLVRFGISGVAATAIYFALTVSLIVLGKIEPVAASVIAYCLSLLASYGLQSRFTFAVRSDSPAQIAKFILTAAVGMPLSMFVMWAAHDLLNAPYFVGAIFVCMLIPVINYLVFKWWVFRQGEVE